MGEGGQAELTFQRPTHTSVWNWLPMGPFDAVICLVPLGVVPLRFSTSCCLEIMLSRDQPFISPRTRHAARTARAPGSPSFGGHRHLLAVELEASGLFVKSLGLASVSTPLPPASLPTLSLTSMMSLIIGVHRDSW